MTLLTMCKPTVSAHVKTYVMKTTEMHQMALVHV